MLAKALGANKLIGVEMNDYRIDLAKKLGLADYVFKPGEDTLEKILEVTDGKGVERAIDASANDAGRQLAIRATREWGKIAFVGRRRNLHLQSKSGYHPWTKDDLWILGNFALENGRTCGETGPVEHSSGGSDHP